MKLTEIERSDTKSRKSLIVLESLLTGHIVEIKNYKYVLAKTLNGGLELCIVAESNVDGEIVLNADMSLEQLVSYSEEMNEDEITILSANLVLNKIKF